MDNKNFKIIFLKDPLIKSTLLLLGRNIKPQKT